MRDQAQTRAQLVAELEALRARVGQLEALQSKRSGIDARFRAMLAHVNVGVCVSRVEGLVEVNQRAAEMWGYATTAEYVATPTREHYVDAKDRETIIATLRAEGALRNFEFLGKRKDGSTFWVSTNVVLQELEPGGEKFIVGVFQDVSERRDIEQRLRSSEARFRVIAEQSMLGICLMQDNRFVYVNQAVADMNGYSVDEMYTWSSIDFARLLHPDDLAFAMEQARKKQAGDPSALTHYEYRLITKSGRVRWAEQYSRTIEYEDRPANFITLIDVTARKQAELMLADEKERLSVTLGSIAEGVITTDGEGRVVSINSAAEEMTGVTASDAVGAALCRIFRPLGDPSGEPEPDLAARVLVDGMRVEPSGAARLTARDGSTRLISTSAVPIRHGGDSVGVAIVFRDVSGERQLSDSLQRAAKLESLGVLAAGIAHDFNNLLGSLYGHIDLAGASNLEESRAHLDLARQAFDRARALTGQLLAFAKGGAPVRSVGAVADTVRECVAFALSGSNVSVELAIEPTLWFAEFDKHQLAQAVDNLVINAKQAMPGGGRLWVTASNVEVGVDVYAGLRAGKYVKISIRDQGPGITREQLARIFDPFFTTKPTGSGLGLTTSYAILKQHDGTLEVDSEPGQGATFHLLLPAVARRELAPALLASQLHKGQGLVLVMDDEPSMRRVLVSMLQRFGYDVEAEDDGEALLEKIPELGAARRRVRFVLLDLTVRAGLGGKDIVGRVGELLPGVPLIASSGYSDDPVMARPRAFGFSASLRKPFSAIELSRLLDELAAATGEPTTRDLPELKTS